MDWLGVLAGGVVAFGLVWLVDKVKHPRVEQLNWNTRLLEGHDQWATFYYLRFRLTGGLAPGWVDEPGIGMVTLEWRDQITLGKWDEMPEPKSVNALGMEVFQPSLVSASLYQPLMPDREYGMPVLVRDHRDQLWVYSSWLYAGYPEARIEDGDVLKITLSTGAGVRWTRNMKVGELVRHAEAKSGGRGARYPSPSQSHEDFAAVPWWERRREPPRVR